MKQQINFRASELTTTQLNELIEWWGVNQSEAITVAVDRIHKQESEKRMNGILSGEIQPETNFPTTGETFYYKNTSAPLVSIGRVPGKTGPHVLRKTDGSLLIIGGYWLRRDGEVWEDVEI